MHTQGTCEIWFRVSTHISYTLLVVGNWFVDVRTQPTFACFPKEMRRELNELFDFQTSVVSNLI
jgi:hypothetical protein